jgi:methionyl-tRNA synthetase
MKSKLYVTTSIPYVNAEPHIGFALELVQADAVARYGRLIGRSVRFQTGTDENAGKNVLAAEQQGLTTQELVDRNAERFRALGDALCISAEDFIRTTESRHRRGVHAFWEALRTDDVVQRDYQGLYCPGCEDFYLARDLVDGRCPDHGIPPLQVAERNYFFRLPHYERWLTECVDRGVLAIVPASRRNEVLSFIRRGLSEFSISRASERTKGWGTPVPGDESQTVYVWVDALINYLSGPGFGSGEQWQDWWSDDAEKVHVIGKNVWKFHAVYWPALLRSVGLSLPDKLLVHGFVTVGGRKIGKSLGNVVDPFAVIEKYGADAVRYYLLRAIPPFADGDFSLPRLDELYRTDLAHGIGNLVSRLGSLCARLDYESAPPAERPAPPGGFTSAIEAFEFDKALDALFGIVTNINREIEQRRPWEYIGIRDQGKLREFLAGWLGQVRGLTTWLAPFLPNTCIGITERLFSGPVRRPSPLFPRL